LRVYRLLFERSVTTAAVVYGAIALIELAHHATSGPAAGVLAFVLADPGRPVIDPVVLTWKSVWEGR